jgi:hypothetical protein
MSLKSAVQSLMGIPFAHPEIIQSSAAVPTLRPAVEKVDTALYAEEQIIVALNRQSYHSDAPILSAQNPVVQAANFRNPAVSVEPAGRAEQLRRARVLRAQQQDAPVEQRQAPLIAAPSEPPVVSEADAWRRSLRYPPIMRKQA